MRIHFISFVLFLFLSFTTNAQNIGIGTLTPAFRLDVATGSINTDSVYRINGLAVLSTKGTGNFFAGTEAGQANTAGSFNVFTGHRAGYSNIGGSSNIFTGYQAGYGNLSGGANIFMGYQAGRTNLSGSGNTFLGVQAGYSNTSGSSNFFAGNTAGYTNTVGYGNVAIGAHSMQANTEGWGNIAIGDSTLYNQTAQAVHNIALGTAAGFNNNHGVANIFIGNDAGFENTDGNFNNFVGLNAGKNNTTGGDNCFFGFLTGLTNTTGSSVVLVGTDADVSAPDLYNAIAIGANARVNCSACLALGSNNRDVKDAATKVGINNAQPLSDLHIVQQSDAAGTIDRGIRLQRSTGINHWRTYVDGSNLLTFEYNDGGAGSWGWINTSGAFISGSDARSKKDIQPLEKGLLSKVMQLEPKKYLFTQQAVTEKYAYGFLAQEVQTIFPECVSEREDGYLGINYGSFSVVAIKAIKEQQELINTLQQQLITLQQQVNKINSRLKK